MAENANPAETIALTVTEEKIQHKEGAGKAVQLNLLIITLTILCFLLSLPVLFSVIWLLYMRQYDCEDLLIGLPKLQFGIAIGLIIVFVVSNVVVYVRARIPVPGLLLVMVPLIIILIVGLALVGACKTESRSIPGSPTWLKTKVQNQVKWKNIKSCIYNTRTCEELVSRSYMLKAYDFTRSKLSYIESGCCRPPNICDMEYVNATFWRKASQEEDASTLYDTDCDSWANEENILCYNCTACKEGFLRTIEGKWLKLGTFLVVISSLLIILHILLFMATTLAQYGG